MINSRESLAKSQFMKISSCEMAKTNSRKSISAKISSLESINGRRIYGGCTPLLRFFLCLTSFLKIRKRFFASVIKIISGISSQNFSFFRWVQGGFRGTPKGGCTPPINLEMFFSDILATATRLNTLYGTETWYVQSPRRVLIPKKVFRHIRHFDVSMMSSMSDFSSFCSFWLQLVS